MVLIGDDELRGAFDVLEDANTPEFWGIMYLSFMYGSTKQQQGFKYNILMSSFAYIHKSTSSAHAVHINLLVMVIYFAFNMDQCLCFFCHNTIAELTFSMKLFSEFCPDQCKDPRFMSIHVKNSWLMSIHDSVIFIQKIQLQFPVLISIQRGVLYWHNNIKSNQKFYLYYYLKKPTEEIT